MAICDTDRSFAPQMTLPRAGHHRLSPLIENTPFDLRSTNPKARIRHQHGI
jgi:hypothetical protein